MDRAIRNRGEPPHGEKAEKPSPSPPGPANRSMTGIDSAGIRPQGANQAILEGALAYFDCRLTAQHDGGDHAIFIGEIVAAGYREDAEPLLWYASGYRVLEAH